MVVQEHLDVGSGFHVTPGEVLVEPRVQRMRPLVLCLGAELNDVLQTGSVVRVVVGPVVPLADPCFVALVSLARVEPVQRGDTGGVVVYSVNGEDGDVGFRRSLSVVAVGVPRERLLVVVGTGLKLISGDKCRVGEPAPEPLDVFAETVPICITQLWEEVTVDREFLVSLGGTNPLEEVGDPVLELVVVHGRQTCARRDGLEYRVPGCRGHRGSRAHVRVSGHAHASVRPLLLTEPGQEVVGVGEVLLPEVIETAAGLPRAAQVGENNGVAARREVPRESKCFVRRRVVRGIDVGRCGRFELRSGEDSRSRPVGDRAVVGAELEDRRIGLDLFGPHDLDVQHDFPAARLVRVGSAHGHFHLFADDVFVCVLDLAEAFDLAVVEVLSRHGDARLGGRCLGQ